MATTSIEPKPSYVSDDSLRPFIQPTFDPADYLNSTLPSLHLVTHSTISRQANTVSLADLSSQTQSLLSQLNAQAARLTNVLTQLTDEILRSGGRLAYEVDVLRGETINLSETLNDTLNADIKLFLPTGLSTITTIKPAEHEESESLPIGPATDHAAEDTPEPEKQPSSEPVPAPEPSYLTHLRTLTTVRNRLNTVIKLFNDAMQWPPPPHSESLLPSNLLSVSSPNANDAADRQARDAKAREFADNLKREIGALVEGHPDGTRAGYEAAMERVRAMRELVGVWRGTGEERARARFVDSLEKVAGERLRDIESGGRNGGTTATPVLSLGSGERAGTPSRLVEKGVGFLDNLSRMRNG